MKRKINLNVFKGLSFLEVLIEIWSVFWRSLVICACTVGVQELFMRVYSYSGLATQEKVYRYWLCLSMLTLIPYVLVAMLFMRKGENRRAENKREPELLAGYPRMLCRVWIYQEVITLLMLLAMIFEGIPGSSLNEYGRLVTDVSISIYFLAQLSFVVISRSYVVGMLLHAAFSALIIYVYYSCFSRFADKKNRVAIREAAIAAAEERDAADREE